MYVKFFLGNLNTNSYHPPPPRRAQSRRTCKCRVTSSRTTLLYINQYGACYDNVIDLVTFLEQIK